MGKRSILTKVLSASLYVLVVCSFVLQTSGEEIPEQKLTLKWRIPTRDLPADEKKIEAREEFFIDRRIDQLPSCIPVVGAIDVYTMTGNFLTAVNKKSGKRVWKYPYTTQNESRLIQDSRLLLKKPQKDLENLHYVAPYSHLLKCNDEHVYCNPAGIRSVQDEMPHMRNIRIREFLIRESFEPIYAFSTKREGFIDSGFPNGASDEEFHAARILGFELAKNKVLTTVEQNSECWYVEYEANDTTKRKSLMLEESVPLTTANARTVTGCAIDANDEIAVCSLAGGAIYGVNRKTNKRSWSFRYEPIKDFDKIDHAIDADRWQFSLVQIVGDSAIVAPGDADWLFSLNLDDGKVQWKLPRNEALYAQIQGDRVFVVGATSLLVLKLSNGKPAIDPIELPGKDRTVGRGCFRDGDVLLPVSSNSILRINAKNVEIKKRYLVDSKPGNLAPTNTGVVSQSALWVSHFAIP